MKKFDITVSLHLRSIRLRSGQVYDLLLLFVIKPQINADMEKNGMKQLTEKVIQCAFAVSNTLGCGFLEKVYENALAHELSQAKTRIPANCK